MSGDRLPASRAEWRIAAIVAGAIVVVFAVFRLALVWRFPPFYDEALYALWTVEGFQNPDLRFVSMQTADEPLFTWLGMGIMWLGAGALTAVRLGSAVCGLVTLVLCGLLGRELGGWRAGLAAAGIAAILPFFVVHDVIGITDPLATTLVTAGLYVQIRLARRPSLAGAILLGLALGGGLLTKPTTYVAIALIPFSLLLFDWSPAGRARRLATWLGCVALALVLAYTLYSIMKLSPFWEEFVRYRAQHGAAASQSAHSIGTGLDTPGKWIGRNWPVYRSELTGYLTIPVILAAAAGLGLGLRRSPRLAGLIGLWLVAPLVIVLLLTEVQYPRYILVGMPPVVVLAGYGSVCALDWVRGRSWGQGPTLAALVALAAVVVLPALVFDGRVLASPSTAHYPGLDDLQYVTGGPALKPYETIAGDLRARAANNGLVVALGDFTSDYWKLEFRDDPSVSFVRIDAPEACSALFAVETQVPLPRRADGMSWREVQVYPRPRRGMPTTLYESGVVVNGRFVSTPDELRAAIGGSDRDYDAFGASRPCVRAWLESFAGSALAPS